jgi:membrane protein required for beta-lactamase induction
MVTFAYVVWLATLHAMRCGPEGDEMHRLLLGMAVVAALMAPLLRATRPFAEIHRMLSWLAAPLALLSVFAVGNTWSAFSTVYIEHEAFCAGGEPPLWQLLWAPAQIAALVVVAVFIGAVWREARRARSD